MKIRPQYKSYFVEKGDGLLGVTWVLPAAAILNMKVLKFYLMTLGLLIAEPIKLWPVLAPGEKVATAHKEVKRSDGLRRISEVTVPTLEVFQAEKDTATGAAVLVCPGGGYHILAIDHEGRELCQWLSKNGITGVLLKYRVPRRNREVRHLAPLQDAQRAMTMIRANAVEWGINPSKIGVMGFSAGGHLAAILMGDPKRKYKDEARYEKLSARPDFGILIYPAYIRKQKDKQELAPELNITKDSPPVFIAVAKNDHSFYPDSVLLSEEFKKVGVPMEFHAFETGGHGFGMGTVRGGLEVKAWPASCLIWMREIGILFK